MRTADQSKEYSDFPKVRFAKAWVGRGKVREVPAGGRPREQTLTLLKKEDI